MPDFPNYRVSDAGQVWSRPRERTAGGLLGAKPDKHGYLRVTMIRDGKRYFRRVHVVVAQSFLGPCPPGLETLHRDGVKANVALANLEYGTSSRNKEDAVRHGHHTNAAKTHCPRGHEYTPENTYRPPSGKGRNCRACRRKKESA